MHFLSARLQTRLVQYPKIHRSPSCLPKHYYIPCISNNCDKNSMEADSSLPSELYLQKMCSDTWTCPSSLGLPTVISAYRLDNQFLTFISSLQESSLCVPISPGWSRQQNCDSPSVLFSRQEADWKKTGHSPKKNLVLPCDCAIIPEWSHGCPSIV